MKSSVLKKITHVIRFSSLFGRASLVFLVAKFLGPNEYADFITISAYVALFVIVLGLDFTRYAQPLIVSEKRSGSVNSLLDLYKFTTLSSVVFIVAVAVINLQWGLSWWLVSLFVVMTIAEYVAQEGGRVLVAINRQMHSAFSLFIRSAAPALFLFLLMAIGSELTLNGVFGILILFAIVSAAYSWVFLFENRSGLLLSFGIPRITLNAIKTSFLFFISTCAVRIFFSADKSLVREVYGRETLATYGLILSAAMVVVPIVDVLIGSYAIPKFLEAPGLMKGALRRSYYRSLRGALMVVGLFYVFGALAFYKISGWVFPEYHVDNIFYVYAVFLVPAIYSVTNIPSQLLISLGAARPMALTSLGGVVVFFAVNFFFPLEFIGFVASFVFVFALILVVRLVYVQRALGRLDR